MYKDTWVPQIGQRLSCKPDERKEALSYVKYALFKHLTQMAMKIRLDTFPLTQRLYHFLNSGTTENKLTAVSGYWKKTPGNWSCCKYNATTIDKRFADAIIAKLNETVS